MFRGESIDPGRLRSRAARSCVARWASGAEMRPASIGRAGAKVPILPCSVSKHVGEEGGGAAGLTTGDDGDEICNFSDSI